MIMHLTKRRAARGFNLVELMIAMTIGLLLMLMVVQLFVGSRRAYAVTDDISRMQENMRFASDVLNRTLRLAGYMSAPNEYAVDTDGITGVFGAGNLAIAGVQGATATASDTVTVNFEGTGTAPGNADGTIVDCLGNPVAAKVIATNIFTIQLDAATGANGLHCQSSLDPTKPAVPRLIVPFVDNMQILYGEDTNADANVDHYVDAASVLDVNRVMSVRIGMLFRTANAGLRPSNDTTPYNVNGVVLPAFNDTYIRRVATMTISLRNRTP